MASIRKPTECPKCKGTNLKHLTVTWTTPHTEGWICADCIQEMESAIFPEAFIIYRSKRDSNKCRVCGRGRDEAKFHKHGNICAECRKAYNKQYLNDNREAFRAQKKEYYAKNKVVLRAKSNAYWQGSPETYLSDLYSRTKKVAARKFGRKNARPLDFNITKQDLIDLWDKQNGRCAVTGVIMKHKWNSVRSASLDRIDSGKGYVQGNVHLVCQFVNLGKGSHSLSDVVDFLDEIRGQGHPNYNPDCDYDDDNNLYLL